MDKENFEGSQSPYEELIKVLCDNKSAIRIAHDPIYHNRIKHVDINRFYMKDQLDNKAICTPNVSTVD